MEDVMLAFRSQELCPLMSKEDIRKQAPLVFAEGKTNPETSERYAYSNTEKLIDCMAKFGWGVTDCKQQRPNKRTKFRSFHTLAFQNPNVFCTNEAGTEIESFPRVIVSTSHDGFHSFRFMAGLYRLVCSNGLILADAEFASFSIRHINFDFEKELEGVIERTVAIVKEKVEVMNKMKQINLTEAQRFEFAKKAIAIRKGLNWEDIPVNDDDITDILEPVRDEDKGNDLFRVFNVLQEKVINGDFQYGKTKTGKRR